MCNVSVIVPVYNGEKYLKECLESILNQTLNDIEIICVNDGSTDSTANILKKFSSKDNRIKILSIENHGQGFARNLALNEVSGEYIAFVDADDWIDSNSLELLFSKAKNDNLDLLFFQMINYIESSKNFVETDLYNHQCFEDNGITEGMVFNLNDVRDFLFEIPVGPVSKLYKKEFLESNRLKFPEGMFFEDNAFFYNVLFKCDRAGFLKKRLYFRRRHEYSVTQTFDESKFDIVKATNFMLNVFINNNHYNSFKINLINHTFSMLLEWFQKSPLNLKQDFFTIIKNEFMGFNKLKEDFENNLNDMYLLIYDSFNHNEYYLDFLSEYKLNATDYVIFDNGEEYSINTDSYHKYKSNLSNDYKVSVIIPIYNNEKFIHRTLMSIENQTLGIDNIEVLMIDDSSTDNTYDVIKEYSNKYVGFKAIHIKKGTGSPGTPRNIGLLEASSNYVIFLDHDDLFEINALKILYDSIVGGNCDFVYGTYASVDIDLPTKIIYPNEMHGYFNNVYENERSIAFPPPSIWTKLFKKDFLIKNNILFPTILGEDAIFVSKSLIKANGINYLWDSLICLHILNKESYTKNISYKYLIEGFTSEQYMYDLYATQGNENFYKIRGEGILDFYLTQFYKANLTEKEIIKIFPSLYGFVNRIHSFGLTPHVSESNIILFNYIINEDITQIISLKQKDKKVSKKRKVMNIIKKVKNKVVR